jgi:hypothetical protein
MLVKLLKCGSRSANRFQQTPLILLNKRLFSDDVKKSKKFTKKYNHHKEQKNQFKKKKGLNNESGKVKNELTYEEETDLYVLKELKNSMIDFQNKNQNVSKIVSQFQDVLSLYGLKIIKAPLPHLDEFYEEAIHLRKQHGTLLFDILIDYKISEIESKEVQLVITDINKTHEVLYLLGDFTQKNGFLFNFSMIINTIKLEKTAIEFKDEICCGDNILFKQLNNYYQKELHVNDPRVLEFLAFNSSAENESALLPEMDGRLLIDALLNYMVVDNLGIKYGDQDGTKLRAILWMLGRYCENTLHGIWLTDLQNFIGWKK